MSASPARPSLRQNVAAVAGLTRPLRARRPLLPETRAGTVAAAAKVRGRKKALGFIVDKAVENIADQKESIGIVLHADCREDADKLLSMLQAKLPDMTIRVENVGPVIGTHAGPGTVAFCFIGKERPQ